ncbi:MAG: HD domain-containing protein [Chloroflexi bacterium]|nr:HD domain-containing protein [Chloroflexota bacterium]
MESGNGVIVAPDSDGAMRIYAYSTVTSPLFTEKLYVILGIPEEAALAQVNGTFGRNVVILGIVAVLSLAAAWLGGDFFFLRRINLLIKTAKHLGAGDTTARTHKSISYGRSELSQLARIFDQMADSLEQREADLKSSNRELAIAYDATLEGWMRVLDLRHKETEGHTMRVAQMTVELARAMGMGEAEIKHTHRGALLHDIGKIGIPDGTLLKPDKLTPDEMRVMRQHPVLAYEMLSPIAYLQSSLDIPYCHHEKWDGTGYPRGLGGEQIPLAARIFAVVDVWDALRSDRSYRKGWPEEKVLDYIREHAGTHFDPQVVGIFLHLVKKS